MSVHPELKETNVRLSPCALDALAAVMARQGTSRDATVRRLLAEHVERQEQEYPQDRLTHISTVLRYPPPPRWRKDPRHAPPPPSAAKTGSSAGAGAGAGAVRPTGGTGRGVIVVTQI